MGDWLEHKQSLANQAGTNLRHIRDREQSRQNRIHVRCSPRLGGELLCAPKQLRHYHSPDDLSWDEWRLSDSEVERTT